MLDVQIVKKNVKNLRDNSCINIMSGRKIKWTETKEKKMYFHRILQICCPKKISTKEWNKYVQVLTTPSKKVVKRRDNCDHFDWASDQEEDDVFNKNGHKDYIL